MLVFYPGVQNIPVRMLLSIVFSLTISTSIAQNKSFKDMGIIVNGGDKQPEMTDSTRI
jgi:hypothetical protein